MRFVVARLAACLLVLVGCAQPSTVDGVVGGSATFEATLEDGGRIKGVFVVAPR